MVVKKKNGKWCVCIDFTDLNKVCPKDSFTLPHIDMLVDARKIHGHVLWVQSNPNAPHDQDKTSFITERGMFCYKVMSLRLKNAGATYQHLVK